MGVAEARLSAEASVAVSSIARYSAIRDPGSRTLPWLLSDTRHCMIAEILYQEFHATLNGSECK
jgi:hypothetical protein